MTYFKQVKKQLKQKLGSQEAKQLLSNSVYLVSVGGNDYLSTYGTNSSVFDIYTPEEYVDIVIGNITSFINVTSHFLKLIYFIFLVIKSDFPYFVPSMLDLIS